MRGCAASRAGRYRVGKLTGKLCALARFGRSGLSSVWGGGKVGAGRGVAGWVWGDFGVVGGVEVRLMGLGEWGRSLMAGCERKIGGDTGRLRRCDAGVMGRITA